MSDSRLYAVLVGAALVIGALFAPWYAIEIGPEVREAIDARANQLPAVAAGFARGLASLLPERIEANAWMAFERTDVVLLATAIGAAFAALFRSRDIAAIAGAIALVNTVWVIVDGPVPVGHVTIQWGLWLALGGALLIVGACKFERRAKPVPYILPADYSVQTAPAGSTLSLADQALSVPPPRR